MIDVDSPTLPSIILLMYHIKSTKLKSGILKDSSEQTTGSLKPNNFHVHFETYPGAMIFDHGKDIRAEKNETITVDSGEFFTFCNDAHLHISRYLHEGNRKKAQNASQEPCT